MKPRRCAICRKPFTPAKTGRRRRYCSDRCRMKAYRKRHKRLRGAALFSSHSEEWATDPATFAELNRRFGPFDLDPCATDENHKCARYFTRRDDGLEQDWTGRVFMNPPYGRTLGRWMAKAWEASQTTAEIVVCLIPARTDTRWWHDYAAHGGIEFRRGRERFGGAANSAPFPSAVVTFRNARAVTEQAALRNGGGVTEPEEMADLDEEDTDKYATRCEVAAETRNGERL